MWIPTTASQKTESMQSLKQQQKTIQAGPVSNHNFMPDSGGQEIFK